MGLFNLFKKPKIVHDDFFGPLRFMDFKDASKNYFEGKGHFMPTNSEVEYLIHADIAGPTGKQKEFYKNLEAEFNAYVQKIKPLIENEFRNWKENFEIKDFTKEFALVCITIPRFDKSPATWEMTFSTIHDLNHQVIVDFVDENPNGILIDG